MRRSLMFGVGLAVGSALASFALPALATASTVRAVAPGTGASSSWSAHSQSGSSSSSSGPSQSSSGSPSASPTAGPVTVDISPAKAVRGGTVTITVTPLCGTGTVSSDAFSNDLISTTILDGGDPLTVRIDKDATLGKHTVVVTCPKGTGSGVFTVVAQTTTKPSGGAGTGGGGAAAAVSTLRP